MAANDSSPQGDSLWSGSQPLKSWLPRLLADAFKQLFVCLFFNVYLFILAAPGLSCSIWDLRCGTQDLVP